MLISLNSRAHRDLIAEFVRRRKALKLTQRDLAEELKRSQSYVALIEKGQKHIYLFEFALLCRAVKADPLEMFKSYVLR